MVDEWAEGVLDAWRRGQAIAAVGPGDVGVHLDHARHLAPYIDAGARCGLDMGTGAGVPGLALAGFRSDITWTLIDAARRRTRLVTEAVVQLGWQDRVTVIHERAELLPHHDGMMHGFDVVVARLFGPPAVTAECAAPLVAHGGQILITEPPIGGGAGEDLNRWDRSGLAALGLERGRRWAAPAVQELRAVGAADRPLPRKPGVAAKRPLW